MQKLQQYNNVWAQLESPGPDISKPTQAQFAMVITH